MGVMTAAELLKLLNRADRLSAAATPDPTLDSYDHGGGRMYVGTAERRTLIADFYQEGDREFYFAARSLVPALAGVLRDALLAAAPEGFTAMCAMGRHDVCPGHYEESGPAGILVRCPCECHTR